VDVQGIRADPGTVRAISELQELNHADFWRIKTEMALRVILINYVF